MNRPYKDIDDEDDFTIFAQQGLTATWNCCLYGHAQFN
jgi:hypothetical protein